MTSSALVAPSDSRSVFILHYEEPCALFQLASETSNKPQTFDGVDESKTIYYISRNKNLVFIWTQTMRCAKIRTFS